MMEEPPVGVTRERGIGIIELRRPEKFNCLSRRCFESIAEALDDFEADSQIRALLVCAQGANFSTGADLEELGHAGPGDAGKHNSALGHDVLIRLEHSRLPVVGAVQGLCLAGGLELMLACDIVLAGASARIGDQHARYGLIPGWGGTQRLPRVIGLRRALDLFYTARWLDAVTAEQWGLVNRVIPDEALRSEALAYCAALSKRNRDGIGLMKRLAREGLDGTLAEGLAAEAAAVPAFIASPSVQEGFAAFLARREPRFE
jgi:enoyl-CoA hydratase